MKILIFGTNGMLSKALTQYFYSKGNHVDVMGLDAPVGYECTNYHPCDLLRDKLEYENFLQYDVILYAAGAGVQAALSTPSLLMYQLNAYAPITITLGLKKVGYTGKYVSFGSYMEIGVNGDECRVFNEDEVVCSELPVTNDYALSKRLYGRYMRDFNAKYTYYHFILPNIFSEDDLKPGTRLIPYTLQYLQDYNAGKNPVAPSFSAGMQIRQFISLEEMRDIVNAAILKHIPSGVYNMGGGEVLRIRQLIERLFALYDVPCKEEYFGKEVRRDGDIKSLHIDGNKLYNAIKKLPSKTIENIFAIQK